MLIDNFILQKCLGKGSFGEVYLTKEKGKNMYYATKKYERDKIENTEAIKYLKNEIKILQNLNHPNIAKFKDIKKTKKHFYIIMEYCNGGELTNALDEYQMKYNRPFSEEIVQYLMRQIIDAFKYFHNKGIMHRDIKLDNILLNYETEKDKENLNIMRAQVKIIDFGFACMIEKNGLAYTAIGNPINMDPLILKKLTSKGRRTRRLGYDQKADIWSLGAICYEMLIGHAAFDADDMEDLVNKIEAGKYKVPTSLSKEVVSFLNGMLQYDSKARYDINELSEHPFITKNIKEFHSIDLRQVSDKVVRNQLVIDVKKNRSIWAIFNKEDEDTLIKINKGNFDQKKEGNEFPRSGHRALSKERKNKIMNNNNIESAKQVNSFPIKDHSPDKASPPSHNYNNQQNYCYGPFLPLANQGIPGNQMYNKNVMPQMQLPQDIQSLSHIEQTESKYVYSGGIYKNYNK